MADRTRPIRIEFCVTEQEKKLIESKMAQLGTRNMGAYLRKMAIDGYIIKVDYTEQKKLAAAVSRAATNINHICRRINKHRSFLRRQYSRSQRTASRDLVASAGSAEKRIITARGITICHA